MPSGARHAEPGLGVAHNLFITSFAYVDPFAGIISAATLSLTARTRVNIGN
jgi:hypothetical protein